MFKEQIKYIERQIKKIDNLDECLRKICFYLNKNIEGYDWVGFYFHDHKKKELNLIAFSGVPTNHTKIPFGKGICGQSALSNNSVVVDDVSKESNYISCNINVKSEIVVPILIDNINIGQIDVDSNTINAFSNMDKIFLEEICELVSKNYDLNKN